MEKGIRESLMRGTKNYPLENLLFDTTDQSITILYHWHPEIEILYVKNGGFTVNIEGTEFDAQDGDIYFVSPDALHSISAEMNVKKTYNAFVFSPSLFSFSEKNDIQSRIIEPLINHKIQLPNRVQKHERNWQELSPLLDRLVELNSHFPHRLERMASTLVLLELFVKMYKLDMYEVSTRENYESDRIRAVISYIEKNYMHNITLKDLAAVCHLSEKYFCSFFKLHTEKTPIEYINYVRIKTARSKLSQTRESVTSIALECGFENIGYFIRQFTRHTGMSPTKWRRENTFLDK